MYVGDYFAAKRSSGVLWTITSGRRAFHGQQLKLKLFAAVGIAIGIVMLALPFN